MHTKDNLSLQLN